MDKKLDFSKVLPKLPLFNREEVWYNKIQPDERKIAEFYQAMQVRFQYVDSWSYVSSAEIQAAG